MAKIKMRKARVASEGVPEPEKVEEKVVKKAGGIRPVFAEGGPAYTGDSGGAVNVTVNVREPIVLGDASRDLAAMIRESMQRMPSILENLQHRPARGSLSFNSTNRLRAEGEPVVNSPIQAFSAALLQESIADATAQIGRIVSGRRSGRISTEEWARQLTELNANITIDPGSPEGDMTVYTTGSRLAASAMELAEAREAESTLVVDPRQVRLDRLMSQFDVKSGEALRSEGNEPGERGRMGERLDADPSLVRNLLQSPTGPQHITNILGITYWGSGRRRICMMECEMDTRAPHRDSTTNLAIVAFRVRRPMDHNMQPFCGSQQYNETIGFFVYNASRGRL